jgi:hypothetical protein
MEYMSKTCVERGVNWRDTETRGGTRASILVLVFMAICRSGFSNDSTYQMKALLTVFGNVVQVVSSNDDCSHHLRAHGFPRQDTSTNANIASKGVLFVNVGADDGFLRSLET